MFVYTQGSRDSSRDRGAFLELVRVASDRYVSAGHIAWGFARGKLRGDPIYEALLRGALLPPPQAASSAQPEAMAAPGGTLIDVGCGAGLTLALLAEARRAKD